MSPCPSQPTSHNPSSPTSLCLQTLPAPGPHVPLEPTPPYLSREGVLGCLTEDQRASAKAPPPPVYLLSKLRPTQAQSHPLAHTSILRGLGTRQPQAPATSPPGRAGADGCPGWGAGCHRACPPPVWVPTAQHAPGLEGVSSPAAPSLPGLWWEGRQEPRGPEAPGSARVRAAPSSSSSPNRAKARLRWEMVLYRRLCPLCPPRPRVSWAGPQVRVQQRPPPPSRERKRASRGGTGVRGRPHMCLSVNNLH